MPIALDVLENLGGREQEALFARDEDGALIRKVVATREMFAKRVTVVIDGIPVEMPAAVPVTDALGNVKNGPDGLPVPRASTIYDAAVQLVRTGLWRAEDLNDRIPVLCHQQHLAPVAVCRVCSVHVSKRRKRDGKLAPSEKLVPACQHEVQADMVVTTREGGYPGWETYYREYLAGQGTAPAAIDESVKQMQASLYKHSKPVRHAVNVLAEFLMTDHYHPDPRRDDRFRNELEDLGRTTGHLAKRMPSMADFNLDDADPVYGAPESLSRQMIDLSVYESVVGDGPAGPGQPQRFKAKLDLPAAPVGGMGKNFAAQENPRARPVALPVVPPPASAEDAREDPDWVKRDQADYEQFPYSARTILVDHDRCILCDRCVRACSDVKPFKIIGHTGKGYGTRISFDLDKLMNDSNCVQCGECMVSCPTGALTLKRRVAPRAFADAPRIPKDPSDPLPQPGPGEPAKLLSAAEMAKVEIKYKDEVGRTRKFRPFRAIPLAYLRWNEGAVRRREVEPGEILCYQGEYGRTAFFLEDGELEILFNPTARATERAGFLARIFGGKAKPAGPAELGNVVATVVPTDTVVGELAALTARPRAATVRAKTKAVVYEVTRNLLDMVQRSPTARDVLGLVYLRNSILTCLRSPQNQAFQGLPDELRVKAAKYLSEKDKLPDGTTRDRAVIRRAEPGEVLVAQGDPANDFYIIRLGTVKVTRTVRGREWVLTRQTTNDIFGQVALLADDQRVRNLLTEEEKAGLRTATVTALDPVEVVRVTRKAFAGLCEKFPELKEKLISDAVRVLAARKQEVRPVESDRLGDFLGQGLYQGQRMLVLDLDSCTRCDECTRACADAHGDGTSRLLREGLRYGQYLVAASCRSCQKPYCMDGCPVDAIHRAERSLEVLIDDHCIGCSLCATNCPFGSIQMVVQGVLAEGGVRKAATVQKAVNCDLCHGLVPAGADPFCVSACPHEAAFRWDAATLDKMVAAKG
jgi:Fe-S-cluster-containing hydrogenase component 2/CRP-like cAMP-binding protein